MLGSLEQFMQKLNEKQLDKNTVIVLQGISGINDIDAVKTDDYIAKFKSDNLVLLAIKDPGRNNFSINNQICESRSWCAIIFTNKETAVNSTGWNFILRRRAVCRKSC